MHDEAGRQQEPSRAPAPAVNVALPGVRSAQDTLSHYERATGFVVPSSSTERKAHLSTLAKLTNAAAPPIEPSALAERWRTQVAELLDAATDEASRDADLDVDNFSDYVQRVLAITGVPPAPPLSRTPSSPSSDMMDLTSDSGSLDDDTASSLQSPPPASPSMPTSGKKVPGDRVHRPGSAGGQSAGSTGGPRIRRPSTASLPGTSFSSPSVSPGPPEQFAHLSFPSSLSLDLDYESHDSEGSEQQQQQQHHLDRRARKQRTTRDLVDQARQQRARGSDESGSSADQRSPEGEKGSSQAPVTAPMTSTSTAATFVHPPRAPTALPRCSADIKADEDEWWLGMDLIPPSGMFHHWMNGGDFVPRTPRLHESSMPFRFGSSSSASSSATSPSRGIPIPGPAHHQHQHQHHQHHQHHAGHPNQSPQPPQLTSSEDFPALPSSPPRSEPPKSQPTRKWHKKTKSKSAAGAGIPTILEADEEAPTRAASVVTTGKRSVSASSAGSSSVASAPVKSTSPANGYHPQPPQQQQPIQPPGPPPHIAAYVQQHPAMHGAPPGFPPAVPPGFAFPPGFPGAGPYGFPPGVPVPQHQQPPQPQPPQQPITNFAQAQGAFGPAAAAAAAAAQLFSMQQQQQQQQGFGAPTRPPGFAGGPPPPGPPPGLRPSFAPGPPPHVMGMYAPHTVYATAQPVGAYYGSR